MHTANLATVFRPLRRIATLLLLGGATLGVLGACNGGDDSEDKTPSPTATPAGSAGPTAAPGAGEFEQLAAKYIAGVDGRVQYSIESVNFGVHPQGTWTTYRRDGEIREDWTQSANGYEETSVAIKANDGFFFCNQTPFTVDCRAQPSEEALEVVLLLFTTVKDFPAALLDGTVEYSTVDLPAETIAGESASCFDVAVHGRVGGGPAGTEQAKLCYGDDGTLLKMERTVDFTDTAFDNAVLTVIAQETGEALETDFDLPASPTQPQG